MNSWVARPLGLLSAGLLVACSAGSAWLESPPRTYEIALADLDGDGDLDAVLANNKSESTAPDTVWWNDGQGAFTNSGQRLDAPIPGTYHVSTGDFDGDGDEDVLFGVFGSAWLVTNTGQAACEAKPVC